MALKLLDQSKINAWPASLKTRFQDFVLIAYPRTDAEISAFPTAIDWADELTRRKWTNELEEYERKKAYLTAEGSVEKNPIK